MSAQPKPAQRKRKGPGRSKSSPAAIVATMRDAEWLKLKVSGKTYAAIGEQYGVEASTVYDAVQKRLRETLKPPSDEMRALEVERLDAQLERLMRAIEAKPELHGFAESLFLKHSEQRAKLLGLNASTKIEMVVPREERLAQVRALLLEPSEEIAALLKETGWKR